MSLDQSPTRRAILWVALAATTACAGGPGSGGAVDDSTYVHVMGELRRVHDERLNNPLVPLPLPLEPGGTAATPERRATRDSLQRLRVDSVQRVDSVSRVAVLARAGVTPEQLMATGRALADDPQRAQRVTEQIGLRARQLDSIARMVRGESLAKSRADSLAKGLKLGPQFPNNGPTRH